MTSIVVALSLGRFNSRSRVGSDKREHPSRRRAPCFNSRSRVGSDQRRRQDLRQQPRFNSRSRVGSDKGERCANTSTRSFNSRSRVGSDLVEGVGDFHELRVSIHAPAWGATSNELREAILVQAFQFTLPRGERPRMAPRREGLQRFNSRSRVGSDTLIFPPLLRRGVSIHAPAWGATWGRPFLYTRQKFQFTLPRGERLPFGLMA